jgi:hypothetical protein
MIRPTTLRLLKELKEHKEPRALRQISSVVAVKVTGGLVLETLMATGGNRVLNLSPRRITPRLRTWATSI